MNRVIHHRLIQIAIVIAAVVPMVLRTQVALPADSCLTQAEYEIYEMILTDEEPLDELDAFIKSERPDYVIPRLKLLVVSNTTDPNIGDSHGIDTERMPDSIDLETRKAMIADLERRESCSLEDKFSAMVPVQIITNEELDSFEGDEYGMFWSNMREKFGPSAVVHFSRVGFDETGEYGVLYYSYSTGGLSGAGYLMTVQRTDKGWRLCYANMIWIS
ncbi:MAG: hypothetical protein KKG33_04065 [candidate division Zixibacteria bacterium]|nr:hypothetical protein [candidate division Zixibacteria bacterium]MBU1470553.1 hypothetical protein [candidate division Zixibacteria bacterium]MBU2624721.1 hypothetical protein [candidate division Zixibacteria bacterium]